MTSVNNDNTKVTFQGNKLTLQGKGLTVGQQLPEFTLTGQDMSDLKSSQFSGKVLVISVVPSLDTPTCDLQTKHFNKAAENLSKDVNILTVSLDLPFAQKRWCGAVGATRVITGSDYKYRTFGPNFGTYIKEWALLGRALFVADKKGTITHVEYTPDISKEPNYDAAMKAVSAAVEAR